MKKGLASQTNKSFLLASFLILGFASLPGGAEESGCTERASPAACYLEEKGNEWSGAKAESAALVQTTKNIEALLAGPKPERCLLESKRKFKNRLDSHVNDIGALGVIKSGIVARLEEARNKVGFILELLDPNASRENLSEAAGKHFVAIGIRHSNHSVHVSVNELFEWSHKLVLNLILPNTNLILFAEEREASESDPVKREALKKLGGGGRFMLETVFNNFDKFADAGMPLSPVYYYSRPDDFITALDFFIAAFVENSEQRKALSSRLSSLARKKCQESFSTADLVELAQIGNAAITVCSPK